MISIDFLLGKGISYNRIRQEIKEGLEVTECDGKLMIKAKDATKRFLHDDHCTNYLTTAELLLSYKEAIDNSFKIFNPLFLDYSGARKIKLVQKYAFFQLSLHLKEEQLGLTWKRIFDLQSKLELEFYTNIRSFYLFVEDLSHKNLLSKVRHGRKGQPASNKLNLPDWFQLEIESSYKKGYSFPKVTEKVNDILSLKGIPKVSVSYVKSQITTYLRNIYGLERNGETWFKQTLIGYENRLKPNWILQVVEADGSRYQIPYYDPLLKAVRWIWIFVILDLYSNKIIGLSVDEFETKEMVLNAFYDQMLKCGRLPATIVTDNSSAINSNLVQDFRLKTEEMYGTYWCQHLPEDPQIKGNVETFFESFHQTLVIEHPDYSGLCVDAKTPTKKLRKAVLERIYRHPKNLLQRVELEKLIRQHIYEHNNNKLTKEKENTPSTLFKKGTTKDATPVEHHEIAQLVWQSSEVNFVRQRLIVKGVEYEIVDGNLCLQRQTELVTLYYNSEYLEYVYVFSDKGKFLGKATKKPEWINDPGNLSPQIKNKLKTRKKSRKSIKSFAKNFSKERSKALENARFEDPIIKNFYEHEKRNKAINYEVMNRYNFETSRNLQVDFERPESVQYDKKKLEFTSEGIVINP